MDTKLENILHTINQSSNHEEKNVGTFTSVYRSPLVMKFLDKYLSKNLVDRKAYQSILFFEQEISNFFMDVMKVKKGKVLLTSGSTESILVSLYFAREKAKERGVTAPNIILPESAHYSFYKCAKILGIETRAVVLNNKYSIDTSKVQEKIDTNTILIVGVLGSTELGAVDDVETLDKIALNNKLPLHIDAAIGGFIIPFVKTNLKIRFNQLKSLQTFNISGHKFGLSLPGCGVLVIKDKKIVEEYSDQLEYLSAGKSAIEGLLVTASPAGLFSLGVNILQFQRQGFKEIAKKYATTKQQLKTYLKKLGVVFIDGSEYTPQLFIYPKDVNELSSFLTTRGWIQSVYTPKGLLKPGIRIVIKKDQEELLLNDFIQDITNFYKIKTKSINKNLLTI